MLRRDTDADKEEFKRRQLGRCSPRHESRMCSSSQQNFGRLLSHAEPNYSGCCATFGTGGGPLNGSGAFLANGRNQHFALIARDGISGSFDMTQSACLSGLTLRARRSRRTEGSLFATFASHALWARGTLLAGASLRTVGSGSTLGTRRS